MKNCIWVIVFLFMITYFPHHSLGKNMDVLPQATAQKNITVPDKALKNLTKRGDWKAWGKIYNYKKEGQAGLMVELYDKDLMFDDLLGKTKTDSSGKFSILYQERDFKELTEVKPDLYIVVKNKRNKPIYSSKKRPRYGAGKTEIFNIILKIKMYRQAKIPKLKK